MLKSQIKECFFKLEYQWDYMYDWMHLSNEEKILVKYLFIVNLYQKE